jgi:ATP-dependent Clp protease ATP-binding subunit ClpC
MPTHRFPVLLCRDRAGFQTAVLVDWSDGLAGYSTSGAKALEQVREFLAWSFQQMPHQGAPDFLQPELSVFKVMIRPEYRHDGKVFPCADSLNLRVPCVHGIQESGLLVATLPLLGIRFYYHEENTLKELATRYAVQKLEGLTPAQLARFLPPAEFALEQIALRVKVKERKIVEASLPPTLQQLAEPLGDRAVRKQFSRPWERDEIVSTVVQKVRHERANVLLVGEPGIGKSSILAAAVQIIEREPRLDRPEEEEETQPRPARLFWLTSGGRIIAGMRFLGQWEERVETVIAELAQISGVLCVDRLLDLVRLGGCDATDSIAAFLQPYLQRNELRLVSEATPAELDACRRLLPGFADLFQIVQVPAFSRPQAVSVLEKLATSITQNGQVSMAAGTIDRVYHLFRRFAPYHVFPGKAVGFVRKLFDRKLRAKRPTTGTAPTVTPEDAITMFVQQTGLPEMFLRDELALDREEVLTDLRRQIIDQEEAVQAAAHLVTTFKAGLNDPTRPIGVLLFCGPTGVGKTALARAIARYFFGHGEESDRLVRLDMSEYAGFDAVERLLGLHDGTPSALIRRVRQQPFCVVLLDEIEKAGPEVFDVLLGVLDEGRLTDRFGRTTTFRSTIILLTSNLGSDKQRSLGFSQKTGPHYETEARLFFRPEFFNRLDGVVTFQPLQQKTIQAITRKELQELSHREGLQRLGLKLAPSERLVEYLAREGFDARYGARPLQRAIERLVLAPMARWLLERPELKNCEIRLDWSENAVAFST